MSTESSSVASYAVPINVFEIIQIWSTWTIVMGLQYKYLKIERNEWKHKGKLKKGK